MTCLAVVRLKPDTTYDTAIKPPGRPVLGISAGVHGNVALRVLEADIFSARANQPVVGVLLEHMRGPARNAADGEDRREQIDGNAERVVGRGRIEIDVRIQLLFAFHQRLDALRHLEPLRLARTLP